jgi:hypothetical protein
MSGVKSFGFDEGKDIRDNSIPKFKGEKGRDDIFGFAWDVPNEIFRVADGHYSKTLQKGWQCLSDPEKDIKEVCCSYDYDGNEAKKKVGCAIVLYKFDSDKKITGIKDIVSWTFSPKTFQQLRAIYLEHGLVDIMASCTNTDFQNFTFVPKKGCAWLQSEKTKEFVKGKADKIYKTLPKLLYSKLSLSEIREHLGISSGNSDASTGMALDGIAGSL